MVTELTAEKVIADETPPLRILTDLF